MKEGGREGEVGERWWVGGGEIEGREFCVRVTMRRVLFGGGALFKEREPCVCSNESWAVRVGGKGIGQEGASWRWRRERWRGCECAGEVLKEATSWQC